MGSGCGNYTTWAKPRKAAAQFRIAQADGGVHRSPQTPMANQFGLNTAPSIPMKSKENGQARPVYSQVYSHPRITLATRDVPPSSNGRSFPKAVTFSNEGKIVLSLPIIIRFETTPSALETHRNQDSRAVLRRGTSECRLKNKV